MKKTVSFVIILTLTGLFVGVSRQWFSNTKDARSVSATDSPSAALAKSSDAPANTTDLTNSSNSQTPNSSTHTHKNTTPTNDGKVIESSNMVDANRTNQSGFTSERHAALDPSTSSPREQLAEELGDMEEVIDTDVVGRKIPISDSILTDCKRTIEVRGDGTPCALFMPFLERMTQEPRDQKWALEMEASLRDYILTDPAELTIRALECRQSLCVAELVSNYGRLDIGGKWVKNKVLEKELYPDTGYMGYESDPSGNNAIYGVKKHVTVEMFTRRR